MITIDKCIRSMTYFVEISYQPTFELSVCTRQSRLFETQRTHSEYQLQPTEWQVGSRGKGRFQRNCEFSLFSWLWYWPLTTSEESGRGQLKKNAN